MSTAERFLKDVAQHEMRIIRDEGVYRHIRFQSPGTMCMHFDLVTWPGYLCYTGDMGTFVFTRLSDMFQFFRRTERDRRYGIDFRYWAEKCEAGGRHGDGVFEFDPEQFKREITKQRRRLFVAHGEDMDEEERSDFWEGLEQVRASADNGEHYTFSAVSDWYFRFGKLGRHGLPESRIELDTSDFPSCKRYTHRFLWCCHALAWAIEVYDAAKQPAAAPVPAADLVALPVLDNPPKAAA